MTILPETHPEYQTEESNPTYQVINFNRVIDRLQPYPEVESVGVSFPRSYPGADSFNSRRLENITDSTRGFYPSVLTIATTGDDLRTFRHTEKGGEGVVSMIDIDLTDPKGIVITKMVEDILFPGQSALGQQVTQHRENPENERVVKAVVGDIKRDLNQRPEGTVFMFQRVNEENVSDTDVSIRLKKKLSATELASFRQEILRDLRIGNYYVKDRVSYDKIMDDFDFSIGSVNTIRTFTALLVFFLLNILLCVMGTFWYRVHARREEIGIRRAMGATKEKIHHLFMTEGMVLLTCILLPAVLIEIQLVYTDLMYTLGYSEETQGLFLPDYMGLRLLITNLLTYLLLTVVMMVSIWYPTWKAGKITPIEALRDD
ncbi:MAG: FtsX-like permease family protein [Tannerellaceae bacterium]|nr:FtsX-like permease family protein [Tannerellaceae bacterium]